MAADAGVGRAVVNAHFRRWGDSACDALLNTRPVDCALDNGDCVLEVPASTLACQGSLETAVVSACMAHRCDGARRSADPDGPQWTAAACAESAGTCAQTTAVACADATTAGCQADDAGGFEDACAALTTSVACLAVDADTSVACAFVSTAVYGAAEMPEGSGMACALALVPVRARPGMVTRP